ncbi:hypothetical protein [Seonamhaeicola marinus]|uniref:DUF4595 domain-containing protein n=1 Tax=Seonamhaeicola marinus TaxID=1912246 RepID=A0A5D0I7D2_9FLAO|nr:hypothetical protein [Seonamhaeicola marinus]TYA78770.1 hypothetical protein FUA24_10485 [Seonamhaeicola marinus]
MKLQQILLSAIAILFLSCSTESSDSKEESDDKDDKTLVTKIIYNKGTDEEFTETYNYDGNVLLNIDEGDGFKTVYTYENTLLVREDHFFGGGLAAYTTLEYNSENKVIKLTEIWLEDSGIDGLSYKHNITYNNSNNTFTDELLRKGPEDGSVFEPAGTSIFSHIGNNISSIKEDDGYEYLFTYDDKNGIFKNVHQVEVLNLLSNNEFGALIHSNSYNLTSYIEKYSDETDYDAKEIYIYTYNDKNYPQTAILKSEIDGEIEEDETIEFVYN